ncbi:thioredoxin domain-containing protein 17-like [Dromiciops gliroides]|uniref:thioredoxin domain-containing protein 17-like n=1 Tax=Dromiciops gliroides TaxID=33562 RepID=UPI001CC64B4A|nr:thioredoxin domain-containing protein 17-like [Dromiciops gliroides]
MAHYEEVRVSGYGDSCQMVEQHRGKTIFAYFTGDKDTEGRSWCPDCTEAEPVVLEALKHIPEDAMFIHCKVGDQPYRKDLNNEFKKKLNLTSLLTLLKYRMLQNMVESECVKASLVEMLFEDD